MLWRIKNTAPSANPNLTEYIVGAVKWRGMITRNNPPQRRRSRGMSIAQDIKSDVKMAETKILMVVDEKHHEAIKREMLKLLIEIFVSHDWEDFIQEEITKLNEEYDDYTLDMYKSEGERTG